MSPTIPTILMPDIPLLRKAVEWVEHEAAKPDPLDREWDQSRWRRPAAVRSAEYGQDCGTSYCVAGYVCQVSGVQWENAYGGDVVGGDHAAGRAKRLLGLRPEEATELFSAINCATTIRRVAEQVAARAGETL